MGLQSLALLGLLGKAVTGRRFKWLQWPGPQQAEAKSQEFHQGLPHGWWDCTGQAVICSFPRCVSRKQVQKLNCWTLMGTSEWDASLTNCSSTHYIRNSGSLQSFLSPAPLRVGKHQIHKSSTEWSHFRAMTSALRHATLGGLSKPLSCPKSYSDCPCFPQKKNDATKWHLVPSLISPLVTSPSRGELIQVSHPAG